MEEEEIYLTSGEQLNEWLTNLRTMTPFVKIFPQHEWNCLGPCIHQRMSGWRRPNNGSIFFKSLRLIMRGIMNADCSSELRTNGLGQDNNNGELNYTYLY